MGTKISKNLLESDLVDAIVALPDKLFYSTGIPVSLWILNRNKKENSRFRKRKHEVLFIYARNLGEMIDRRHRELKSEDIKKIADTYHGWRTIENEELKGNGEPRRGELCSSERAIENLRYVILNEVKNLRVLVEVGGEFE